MTANLYGHYEPSDVPLRLHGDIAHFAKKHGVIPNVVRMHPELMPDGVDDIVIQSERGKMVYTVKLVADKRVQRGTCVIESLDSSQELK